MVHFQWFNRKKSHLWNLLIDSQTEELRRFLTPLSSLALKKSLTPEQIWAIFSLPLSKKIISTNERMFVDPTQKMEATWEMKAIYPLQFSENVNYPLPQHIPEFLGDWKTPIKRNRRKYDEIICMDWNHRSVVSVHFEGFVVFASNNVISFQHWRLSKVHWDLYG